MPNDDDRNPPPPPPPPPDYDTERRADEPIVPERTTSEPSETESDR